jgi:hypothetical protein
MYIDGYLRCYGIEQDSDRENIYIVKFVNDENETDAFLSVEAKQINEFKIGALYKMQLLCYQELKPSREYAVHSSM